MTKEKLILEIQYTYVNQEKLVPRDTSRTKQNLLCFNITEIIHKNEQK